MESNLADKQFKEKLENFLARSEVKRWKRAFYSRERTESITDYYNRLSTLSLSDVT